MVWFAHPELPTSHDRQCFEYGIGSKSSTQLIEARLLLSHRLYSTKPTNTSTDLRSDHTMLSAHPAMLTSTIHMLLTSTFYRTIMALPSVLHKPG